MKTQSIKSIATLLGLAVTLNVSALAGPGPQPQVQTWYAGQGQSVATPVSPAQETPTIAFGGTKLGASESHGKPSVFTTTGRMSAPAVTAVNGPHGIFFVYR
jgi:hypothetical protein